MLSSKNDIGSMIRRAWRWSASIPGGRRLFSRFISCYVPYTGSIRADVLHLAPGHGKVQLRDRMLVRNHLKSIHAIAQANLAEMASGLALMYSLPPQTRGILVRFEIAYVKKARGTLTATCNLTPPESNQHQDFEVTVQIHDSQNQEVAQALAVWRLGPTN